jgi:two-component system, chemotaxis family, chemotaxis protein CheY
MKTLLVVDDSATLRKLYSLVFEEQGYNVITAANGIEGLKMVREKKPDAIITDIDMPELDGRGFLRGLDDYTGSVIVVTAINVQKSEFLTYTHVRGVYRKPVEKDELVVAVRQLM